ncbi:MAG: (2Fe-2S)-binding protein [Gammaproteobacteria bacterium]
MNGIRSNTKTDFICYCSGTTVERIKELVADGIDTLDGLSGRTGACAGCGSCETAVAELLAHLLSGDASHPEVMALTNAADD